MTSLGTPFLVKLAEATDATLVGGKAVNLAAMIQAGLPVPDGFVVTTAAFRSRVDQLDAITSEICQAYEGLQGALVAVRSSATAEDLLGASMAGQYDTFLNLADAEQVVDAVTRCWNSVTNDRVAAYLHERGIDPAQVAMAVVVQRLVSAEVAGVLFTTNPRTGCANEILIEASWGLGETVVSGDVQPDIVCVAAEPCEVLDYTVADKAVRLRSGMTAPEPVPPDLRRRACLNFAAIRSLCRLGQSSARFFGHPQDIEWAIDSDGRVHLLQSRAITTLDDAATLEKLRTRTVERLRAELEAGRGPWVRHNLDETLVNPTPLSWDVVGRFMAGRGGFGTMHRNVGFMPSAMVAEDGFLERIGNGIYMDCARAPEMFFSKFPLRYDTDLLRRDPDASQRPPTLPNGTAAQRAIAGRQSATVTDTLRKEAATLDLRFDNIFVPKIDAWLSCENARDLASLDDEALVARWQQREQTVMGEFGAMAFLPSMIEGLAVADLRGFANIHLWDHDPDEIVNALSVSPMPDKTLLANAELRETAIGARTIERWLLDHGHRAPGEFDLATPRWYERPEDIKRMAESLRHSPDPATKHHQRVDEAEDLLAQLKRSLSPRKATQLDEHIRLLQRYLRFREDGKYHWMRAYAVLRATALRMGDRLGIGDDVFYLTVSEISDALRGGYLPTDRIETRRVERRAADRFATPRVIDRCDLATLGQLSIDSNAEQWPAHPVSCGAATGRAKVVFSPETAAELGVDYILVCPSTDPSWTPLFSNAAGLVLERGGTLSHGAIVARELGLPAVVLESATSRLTDGETIHVDAIVGRVARAAANVATAIDEGGSTLISRSMLPPPISPQETTANQLALLAAMGWGVFLVAFTMLPAAWLKEPTFRQIDEILWPLVRSVGMVTTVTIVGGSFSLFLLIAQLRLTENARLFEAKRRSAALRASAARLTKGSPRQLAMTKAAHPTPGRVLRASMVPLAWVLGPMMLVFLWFPERFDPAVWNADPGREINLVVRVDGDASGPLSLELPAGVSLAPGVASEQSPPAIRAELEELRREWTASDLADYPWEVQAAGDYAREMMVSSLTAFLRGGLPPHTLNWRLNVPSEAFGRHVLGLRSSPNAVPIEIPLVFGNSHPPQPLAWATPEDAVVQDIEVIPPRSLSQRKFWTPLAWLGGPAWDFGWLGVYLTAYLTTMLIGKRVLKIP